MQSVTYLNLEKGGAYLSLLKFKCRIIDSRAYVCPTGVTLNVNLSHFNDHFSGPGSVVSPPSVCVCSDDNFRSNEMTLAQWFIVALSIGQVRTS